MGGNLSLIRSLSHSLSDVKKSSCQVEYALNKSRVPRAIFFLVWPDEALARPSEDPGGVGCKSR